MTLISPDEAVQRVLHWAAPLPTESRALEAADGFVLSSDVIAHWDMPPANVSMMDGYAVRLEDIDRPLKRMGESAAGHPSDMSLLPGHAMPISTGAVVPHPADIVIPREDIDLHDDGHLHVDLARFGERKSGRWIRPQASDIARGQPVLTQGTMLGAAELAAAASVGALQLDVIRKPTVALLSTGDELVPLGTTPHPGQVVNTNALMLRSLIHAHGGTVIDFGIARDDPDDLTRKLADALHQSDIVITSGGISVGDHDHVATTLTKLGCEFSFHGVAMKPGRPVAFARCDKTLVFALPGNPASTMVGFWLLVHPALTRLRGGINPVPRRLRVTLRTDTRGAGTRSHYIRARLHGDGTATPLRDQRSGNLTSMIDVDALIIVPAGTPSLKVGDQADAILLNPWSHQHRSD